MTVKTVLVTGGAGYIGTHTMVELLTSGYDVVCLDNFSNSSPEAVKRVEKIAGKRVTSVTGDVRDREVMSRVFKRPIDGVIHFAALKAVGESVAKPTDYYGNNVGGSLALLEAMNERKVRRIVFSSSATVYGVPETLPLSEDAPVRPINPYGHTKAMVEQILRDWCAADLTCTAIVLRYFNPIGAHPSGTIGEDPHDVPNNLFPFIAQVAIGKRDKLTIWGGDWETPDGTGVRDYLHVVDLARGHVDALRYGFENTGYRNINLGTGQGTSVLQMVAAFERAASKKISFAIGPRRAGDVAACWADGSSAQQLLGWRAAMSVEQACVDGWRWQQQNPDGYRGQRTAG
ncbi:MAG: UDP-glucose 4-epimerase GalE [Burkholderiaceae bacterium]|nr:UDP-glucose 4-epimerase GalE [Burkholderiaceae bacterium]